METYYIVLRYATTNGVFRKCPLLMSNNEDEILEAFNVLKELFIRFGYEAGARTIGSKNGTQIYIEIFD